MPQREKVHLSSSGEGGVRAGLPSVRSMRPASGVRVPCMWAGNAATAIARVVSGLSFQRHRNAGDLAALIRKVIDGRMFDRTGIYHFSDEGVCSWYDFAVEICRMFDNECDILPCHSDEFPSKVRRPHFSVLDKTKVKAAFGIKIPHWRQSLRRCVNEILSAENEVAPGVN